MKFRSAEQAVRFAYNMQERTEYSRTDLTGTRGTSTTDLTPMDLHAQGAMILSRMKRMHQVERDSVIALCGRGRDRTDAIRSLAEYLFTQVSGTVPGKFDLSVVMMHWATKRPAIRAIADARGVSYRQVCNWRSAALRAWMPLHARAINRLHDLLFEEGGLELDI